MLIFAHVDRLITASSSFLAHRALQRYTGHTHYPPFMHQWSVFKIEGNVLWTVHWHFSLFRPVCITDYYNKLRALEGLRFYFLCFYHLLYWFHNDRQWISSDHINVINQISHIQWYWVARCLLVSYEWIHIKSYFSCSVNNRSQEHNGVEY